MDSIFKSNVAGSNLNQLANQFGMDDPNGSSGLADFLKELFLQAGKNNIVQVNDCETAADWTESDNGTFDLAAAATGKRVGTNCVSLTSTAACDGTQYVRTALIDESDPAHKDGINFSDTDYLGFWKHAESSGDFGTAGELKFAFEYVDGTLSDLQSVGATVTTVHDWEEIDISGLKRTGIAAIRFYCFNATVGEAIYIDDILRYKLSYAGTPLYGGYLPIKSAEAIANGDTIDWSIDGAFKSTAAAVTNLGTGLVPASVTGTGKRNKWVHIPNVYLCIVKAGAATVAGEGLIWKANGTVEGVSTGVEEYVMYKGLEAAGAAGDHIFALKTTHGVFIS